MKRKWVVSSVLVLMAGACAVWYVGWRQNSTNSLKTALLPYGWYRHGEGYKIELDHVVIHGGNSSVLIRCVGTTPGNNNPFGTLLQRFKADDYRGKTVRLSAYARTEEADWAALWLRVDGQKRPSLRFDNMQDRPIRGTTGWQKYEITLDVPEDGFRIFFGALLGGEGKMWVDDFRFEVVGGGTAQGAPGPTAAGSDISLRPVDLDFEQ